MAGEFEDFSKALKDVYGVDKVYQMVVHSKQLSAYMNYIKGSKFVSEPFQVGEPHPYQQLLREAALHCPPPVGSKWELGSDGLPLLTYNQPFFTGKRDEVWITAWVRCTGYALQTCLRFKPAQREDGEWILKAERDWY